MENECITVKKLKEFVDYYLQSRSDQYEKDGVQNPRQKAENDRVLLIDDGLSSTFYRAEFCVGTGHGKLIREPAEFESENVLGIVFNRMDPEK